MEQLPRFYFDKGESKGSVVFGGFRAASFIKKVVANEAVDGDGNKYSFSDAYPLIMEIHSRLCMPIGTGSFLRESSSVTVGGEPVTTSARDLEYKFRAYCYWLEEQMEGLKENRADPVAALKVAAAAHYGLTWLELHPFDNGNGRTARALVNAILMVHSYELVAYHLAIPPVPILRESSTGSDKYIKSLRAVRQTHSLNPFMVFLAQKWSENITERLDKIRTKIGVPKKQSDKKLIEVVEKRKQSLDNFISRGVEVTNDRTNGGKVKSYDSYLIPTYVPSRFSSF